MSKWIQSLSLSLSLSFKEISKSLVLAVFLTGVHEGVRRESGQFCRVCSATDCGCAELVCGESFKEAGTGAPELGTGVELAQIGEGKVCAQLH
jgi:hypothetical protein